MRLLRSYWESHPLRLIVGVGILFRLLATLFSKGYGMQDDHFLIIEVAQSWADHAKHNNWLPGDGGTEPDGHSLFYSGLHYFLFCFFNWIGFTDPDLKMYVIRFIHASFSVLSIVLGFKITYHYSNLKTARLAGLLLAIYWFMPLLSVRNLVEVVCVPFLLYATWLIIQEERAATRWSLFLAGIVAGIAFSIRFQTLFFIGGFFIYLALHKNFKGLVSLFLGAILCIGILQGIPDSIIWHYPFAEFGGYVNYNMHNAYSYTTLPWYNYFLTLGGILLPPISLFLLFGFFNSWKKNILLFLPSFIFLAFHSYFPNKQERFIFPIIPFVIILGLIGWNEWLDRSEFWKRNRRLLRFSWGFFWILNGILLCFLSVSYTKRNRVESMLYLQHKGDVHSLIIEDSNNDGLAMLPQFYLKKWVPVYGITSKSNCDSLVTTLNTLKLADSLKPNYVLFMQGENLQDRVKRFESHYASLHYEATIEPGTLDKILHWLNPNNDNNSTTIYKIEKSVQKEQKP